MQPLRHELPAHHLVANAQWRKLLDNVEKPLADCVHEENGIVEYHNSVPHTV